MTNPLKCDTIRVQKERDGNPETRAAHESEVRPVPDDPTARCVGLRYISVDQSQFAEEMLDYAYYKATPTGAIAPTNARVAQLVEQ